MKLAIVLATIASVLLCAAPGLAAPSQTTTLRADVAEWSIVPSSGAVRAGHVRLVVHNLGASVHQITVVRTTSFGARLPLAGAHAAVHGLAASALVRPGGTIALNVSLKRGSYMLLDNLPWSYWKGTSVAFSVR